MHFERKLYHLTEKLYKNQNTFISQWQSHTTFQITLMKTFYMTVHNCHNFFPIHPCVQMFSTFHSFLLDLLNPYPLVMCALKWLTGQQLKFAWKYTGCVGGWENFNGRSGKFFRKKHFRIIGCLRKKQPLKAPSFL